MNRILRLSSLALTLVVTIALMATTMAPAQAQPPASVADRATQTATTVREATGAVKVQPRPAGTSRDGEHLKVSRPQVNQIGHDYCGGWLQGPAWCLTFNKIEAGYIAAVSLATAAAFICAGTALITCGAAVGIAAAIQRYVDRNGVCPKSRPKMRVEYFPRPGRVECV
jgi:hypothetical protein